MNSGSDNDRLADLAVVYREYQGFVWRTLYHFGLRSDGINDAVQEVFVVAHRRLGDFDGRSSIKNWLYGIARRVAADMRKKDQRASAKLRLLRSLPAGGEASMCDQLSASELVEVLLESMGDEQREVFILAEIEGMTAPEITEVTGININTVYSRLRSARGCFHREARRIRARHRRRLA